MDQVQAEAYRIAREQSGLPPALFDMLDLLQHAPKLTPADVQGYTSAAMARLAAQTKQPPEIATTIGKYLLGQMTDEQFAASLTGGTANNYYTIGKKTLDVLLKLKSEGITEDSVRSAATEIAGIAAGAACTGALSPAAGPACAATASVVVDAMFVVGKAIAVEFFGATSDAEQARIAARKAFVAWQANFFDIVEARESELGQTLRFYISRIQNKVYDLGVGLSPSEEVSLSGAEKLATMDKITKRTLVAMNEKQPDVHVVRQSDESGFNGLVGNVASVYAYEQGLILHCSWNDLAAWASANNLKPGDFWPIMAPCAVYPWDISSWDAVADCCNTDPNNEECGSVNAARALITCAGSRHAALYSDLLFADTEEWVHIMLRDEAVRQFKLTEIITEVPLGITPAAPGVPLGITPAAPGEPVLLGDALAAATAPSPEPEPSPPGPSRLGTVLAVAALGGGAWWLFGTDSGKAFVHGVGRRIKRA